MNREIKFRAWHTLLNEWVEEGWCLQKHIPWSGTVHKNGITPYWLHWIDDYEGYDPFWVLDKVASQLVLQQFTGLKDKNGKEIYEGDIVKLGNSKPKQVYFDFGSWKVGDSKLYDNYLQPEIIGNIYENSNLLNESN